MTKKKADVTFAQEQTLAKLQADAESYGHSHSTERAGDRVVFVASGRRWPVRPNGTVDPVDEILSKAAKFPEPEKRKTDAQPRSKRRSRPSRAKSGTTAKSRSEAAKKAAATRKRNQAKAAA